MAIAGIPKLVKYRTWSSISDRKITLTLEPRGFLWTMSTTIGRHWNINDFPEPVGKFTKTFFPWKKDLIAFRCSGRRSGTSNWDLTVSKAAFQFSSTHAILHLWIASGYSQYSLAGDSPYPVGAIYIQFNNSFIKRPITHDYTDPSSSLEVSDKDVVRWRSQTRIFADGYFRACDRMRWCGSASLGHFSA